MASGRFDSLLRFTRRYSNDGIIRPEVRPVTPEEANQLLSDWRRAFHGFDESFDALESRILSINGVQSHSSATREDMRLYVNFAQHAQKELPRGTAVEIEYTMRQIAITYPEKPGVKNRYAVTWESIDDAGIVRMLDVLKSATGEYLGDTAQKPRPAKSLGQNKVLPARRLRLGRYADEKSGAG